MERRKWVGGMCLGRNDRPCCVLGLSHIIYVPVSLNNLDDGLVPSAYGSSLRQAGAQWRLNKRTGVCDVLE